MKVDTFPFLAVLLCAMGALIIVLLIMDRKAKQVARQRAMQSAQTQLAQREQTLAEREAEQARQQAEALAAWQRERDTQKARIDAEQAQLEAQRREALRRKAEVERQLASERQKLQQMRDQLAAEQAALAEAQKQLAQADEAKERTRKQLQEAETARSLASTNLHALERALGRAQSLSKDTGKTFSLVPYGGKRGANSRPVYAECDRNGVVFHPEGKRIATAELAALRAEAVRRLEARGEDSYLMLLVRPDGIEAYYRIRKALDDLEVTFGYELVDADWKFDTSGEPKAPTGPAAAPQVATRPTGNLIELPALGPGVDLNPPRRLAQNGPGLGLGIGTQPPGASAREPSSPPGPAMPALPETGMGPSLGPPLARPAEPQGSPALLPPALVLGQPRSNPGTTPSAAVTQGSPPTDSRPPRPSDPPTRTPQGEERPSAAPAGAVGATETTPPEQPQPFELPPTTIKPKAPWPKKEPLRAVRLESNEITVFVECYPDSVVVYPSKKVFGPAGVRGGQLMTQVKQGLSRPLLGGGTPKLQVRFLIRPGGERMLHPSLEALRPLGVTMSQYIVQPEDDVQKIVTQR
jgi:hypothetical protein